MIENITIAAKMKALLAVAALLLVGGVFSTVENVAVNQPAVTEKTGDTFSQSIIESSDLVQNAVLEAVNQQGKQSPLVYKQTCESVMSTIRGERLDTEYNYNTLDASQKELVQEYRDYLKEAANVVIVCASGETPDLTKMEAAKAALS